MNHSGKIQRCPPWTQRLKLQEDSRAHLWSEFSSVWATSCGIDLHDVVIGGRQHQDLLHVAMVEHLPRAKWVQPRHGYPLLLMVAAAHRVHAASAADACRVHLVIQQGQTVVLHAAVWGHWAEVSVSIFFFFFSCWGGCCIFPPQKSQQIATSPVVLTRVWLVKNSCSVRQVLQNVDPGVGEVSGKQRHHLNLHLLTRSSYHWYRHQPWTLPTHCPVTVAVSHWGDKWKQVRYESQSQREGARRQEGTQCSEGPREYCKVLLPSLWSPSRASVGNFLILNLPRAYLDTLVW